MHDVVVVGAGGAGIPLAVRLAQRGVKVLLLEAGSAAVRTVPTSRVPGARGGGPHVSGQLVGLTEHREWQVYRGTGLGGSTAVNGGYFIRARRHDFEAWAQTGGAAWSPEAVLPVLRRLESDLQFGSRPGHGDVGPMPVDRSPFHPLAEEFTGRALAAGAVLEPDKNGDAAPGVGPVPMNARSGARVSTAVGYLAQGTPAGLEIRTGVRVLRVRLVGGRAVGVETVSGFVPAGEVVLTAGALASAHLLLLSGIGPAACLTSVGVPVASDLPVGEGLSDHPQVVIEDPESHRSEDAGRLDPQAWLGAALHLTSPRAPVPGNLEILQSLLPMAALVEGRTAPAVSTLLVSDLTPVRRGGARLVSAHPDVALRVDLGYLSTPQDRSRLRHAVREAALLTSTPTRVLGGSVEDDDDMDRRIRTHLTTAVHTCGSAPIGTVVDGAGRVLGIAGLGVADTSILPTAPTRGPANTAVLLGELMADLVAG